MGQDAYALQQPTKLSTLGDYFHSQSHNIFLYE
jgi:hypothetical protein